MKLLFISLVSTVSFVSISAIAENLPRNVVAEQNMKVGFAPQDKVGEYKFQVLASGEVQKVDNKKVVTVLAKLTPEVVTKFISIIDTIKSDELSQPTGPQCADAPTVTVTLQQTSGKNVVVMKKVNCREARATDGTAIRALEVLKNLYLALIELR